MSDESAPESRRYGPYVVELSRPDKVLFPECGVTKRDLADHAERVADVMLPHVEDRSVTMHRFPDGIEGDGFYHKAAPDHFPDWVRRARVVRRSGGAIEQIVIGNAATLVLLADQGCITPHVGLARVDDLEHPDRLVWDLDPADDADDPFDDVRFAARRLLEVLDDLSLPGFVQTTGSRGLHVVVPVRRTVEFDRARGLARRIARRLAEDHEDRLTLAARKDARGDRLYLDVGRNAYGQTMVAPYAVRPRPNAPVATPIDRSELDDADLAPDRWTVGTIGDRLAERDDPWQGMGRRAVDLRRVLDEHRALDAGPDD